MSGDDYAILHDAFQTAFGEISAKAHRTPSGTTAFVWFTDASKYGDWALYYNSPRDNSAVTKEWFHGGERFGGRYQQEYVAEQSLLMDVQRALHEAARKMLEQSLAGA